MPSREFDGVTVLGVFAHPDDESLACGGLLAACAERGATVALLCLTRGEAGPGGDPRRLGEVRAGELRQAARVLGVADVTILSHQDGMLPFVEPEVLERDIASAIRRLAPGVVITFDLDGLYWHPDHVAAHERTTAVVAALGGSAPALWYVSMPPGSVRALVDAAAGSPEAPFAGIRDPDAFGALAPAPSLIFTDERAAARKVAALRCHRTQTVGTALDFVAEADAARLLATEHYRRAEVGARGDTLVERLGLPAATTRA
jgi:N-acetyl-1-D-myo-inositol-2-amino-2-deoxy-alpha-D-glucopyranoside deacetylase